MQVQDNYFGESSERNFLEVGEQYVVRQLQEIRNEIVIPAYRRIIRAFSYKGAAAQILNRNGAPGTNKHEILEVKVNDERVSMDVNLDPNRQMIVLKATNKTRNLNFRTEHKVNGFTISNVEKEIRRFLKKHQW